MVSLPGQLPRLVEGGPVFDPVPELVGDNVRVLGEVLDYLSPEPAAARFLQCLGEVEVV